METLALGAMEGVYFYEDAALSETASCGANTSGSGEEDVCLGAVNFNVASFDDGPVDVAEVALANLCGHVGEVEIGVANLVEVDVLAEVGVGGVGSTEAQGLFVGEYAVAALTCAGTGEDVDLEGPTGFVFDVCFLSYFGGDALRYAGRCEAREAEGVAVLNHCCGFGSSKTFDHYLRV